MCNVFDGIDRTLAGGARGSISHFDYLNNSNRTEAEAVRGILQDCLSRYPVSHRPSLASRLRTHDDVEHLSASFELILHELLLRAGCSVDLPPQGPNVPRRPDFVVTPSSGQSFYLEATIPFGRSQDERAARRRLATAYNAIDSVNSPEFLLTVRTQGTPSEPISGRRLKQLIDRWLAGLSYEAAAGGAEMVPLIHEEHGCRFEIGAVPRRSTRGLTNRPAIGIRGSGAEYVRTSEAVRKSVSKKATRYGDLDLPYIVAINAMHEAADEYDVISALLGSVCVIVRWGHGGPALAEESRNPDGAWFGPSGPVNTRVSAVLSTDRLSFWSLGQRRLCLFHNPWAARPLSSWPLQTDVFEPAGNELRRSPGSSLAEFSGLPDGWPEANY